MKLVIVFKCITCQCTNNLNEGIKGFEYLPSVYTTLTEAMACVKAGHEVYADLEEGE